MLHKTVWSLESNNDLLNSKKRERRIISNCTSIRMKPQYEYISREMVLPSLNRPQKFRPVTSNGDYGLTEKGFNPVNKKERLSLHPSTDIAEESCKFSQL